MDSTQKMVSNDSVWCWINVTMQRTIPFELVQCEIHRTVDASKNDKHLAKLCERKVCKIYVYVPYMHAIKYNAVLYRVDQACAREPVSQ